MPTGYTEMLQDGKATFRQFALTCARAFGATVMQREQLLDVPPAEQVVDQYYVDQMKAAERELLRLKSLSLDEVVKEMTADEDAHAKQVIELNAKKEVIRRNYESMLGQVEQWLAPTGQHVELRDFMVKQIKESIDFDCTLTQPYTPSYDVTRWLKKKIENEQRSVKYHAEAYAAEVKRTAERNAWIRELYASLLPVEARTL